MGAGTLKPGRTSTWTDPPPEGIWSAKPLKPYSLAAVRPPRAAPDPDRSSATRSNCSSVSGPEWATTTPLHGRCHRAVLTWTPSSADVMQVRTVAVSRTPPRSAKSPASCVFLVVRKPMLLPLRGPQIGAKEISRLWMNSQEKAKLWIFTPVAQLCQ